MKSYSELLGYSTFDERFEYLRTYSKIGDETFANYRYYNQQFYKSVIWKEIRRKVIIRDNGCDMGLPGYEIAGPIFIHHINPITIDDILEQTDRLLNLDNLVCVSELTHKGIHYGTNPMLYNRQIFREPGDTCPWKE